MSDEWNKLLFISTTPNPLFFDVRWQYERLLLTNFIQSIAFDSIVTAVIPYIKKLTKLTYFCLLILPLKVEENKHHFRHIIIFFRKLKM